MDNLPLFCALSPITVIMTRPPGTLSITDKGAGAIFLMSQDKQIMK